MLKPQGYGVWTDPQAGSPLEEKDSLSCGHCGKHVWVKPGTGATVYHIQHLDPETGRIWWTDEAGAFCRICMRPVCLPCHDLGTCLPLERFLEQQESTHVTRA